MSKLNMNWKADSFTVYALNEQGVNDFSFNVQGNGRNGHDPKTLQKVVSMAEAAPDMYLALRGVADKLPFTPNQFGGGYSITLTQAEVDAIRAALAKADGEL